MFDPLQRQNELPDPGLFPIGMICFLFRAIDIGRAWTETAQSIVSVRLERVSKAMHRCFGHLALVFRRIEMNNVKLNVVNALVVLGLVAASMAMPLVAANLADSQSVSQTTLTQGSTDFAG
ncbi:MAG: hypothetical protein CMP08_07090 [Xanthomonadales bacterium]|nr:hypothetical protein [Xanthomonadales bacterium]